MNLDDPYLVGAALTLSLGVAGRYLDTLTEQVRRIEVPRHIARPVALPRRPQTLEQAYNQFIGHDPFAVPDWKGYEEAVALILAGAMPTEMGHHPDCQSGRYPMGLEGVRAEVHPNGNETIAVCMECGYRLS